jgi:hypothetical protein
MVCAATVAPRPRPVGGIARKAITYVTAAAPHAARVYAHTSPQVYTGVHDSKHPASPTRACATSYKHAAHFYKPEHMQKQNQSLRTCTCMRVRTQEAHATLLEPKAKAFNALLVTILVITMRMRAGLQVNMARKTLTIKQTCTLAHKPADTRPHVSTQHYAHTYALTYT